MHTALELGLHTPGVRLAIGTEIQGHLLMGTTYELHADEAWTHDGCRETTGRYRCFFGGVFGPATEMDRLQSRLNVIKAKHGLAKKKANWKHLSHANASAYRELVDEFFALLESNDLRYRQQFLDRSYMRTDADGHLDDVPKLEVQFKTYYQFLKHAFWLKALPAESESDPGIIMIRLDRHSSSHHQERLIEFAERLPESWVRPDLEVRIAFIRAKTSIAMQVCDLLCGAAGSHGNQMHKRRGSRKRGMTDKQKLRHEFAKHVYLRFREHDKRMRGSGAFNWFESTGTGTDLANRFNDKMRVWKFVPDSYVVDKGWQNDHLDNHGKYQGRNLQPRLTPLS